MSSFESKKFTVLNSTIDVTSVGMLANFWTNTFSMAWHMTTMSCQHRSLTFKHLIFTSINMITLSIYIIYTPITTEEHKLWCAPHKLLNSEHLYILNAVRCTYVCMYVHSSITLGVARSVANDVIMRTGAASDIGATMAREVIMRIRSQW